MVLPSRLQVFFAVLVCCTCFVLRANSQSKTAQTERATVSGKVKIKGKPAAGVVVGMRLQRAAQTSPTFKASTNQDGIYKITDVPAGSYFVAPLAPAFVISDSNNEPDHTVVITESADIEGINFDLVRGAVITGKITDPNGQPAIEQAVQLIPADPANRGNRAYYLQVGYQTDDRGIYRMFGIRPGRYKLSVGGERDFYLGNPRGRAGAFPKTFHPDTTDETKAAIIEVAEGSEASKIDIVIAQPPEGFSVSGRIVDAETGNPIPNLQIGLTKLAGDPHSGRGLGVMTGVSSDNQGEFRIQKVQAGKYELTVELPPSSDLRYDESLKFELFNQDVTGLTLRLAKGASVSGTVVLEGSKNNDPATMAQFWLSVYIRNDSGIVSGRGGQVNPDGSFKVGGLLPGPVSFSFGGPSRDRILVVTRVERDGVLQPNGITLQSSKDQITGIRVVVSSVRTGSIRGVVKTINGVLPAGARMVVQVVGVADGNPYGGVEVDSRGHFLTESLVAGNYELRVLSYVPGGRQTTMSAKQFATVAEGTVTNVTLTLDLAANPNP